MRPFLETPVRLLATDLDGTLLNSLGQVSQVNAETIQLAKEHDIITVAATARSIRSTAIISDKANLGPFAICQNGAAVYDLKSGELLSHTSISEDASKSIVATLRKVLPGTVFSIEKLDRFIPESGFFPTPLPGLFEEPVENVIEHIDAPITKIICRHPMIPHHELRAVAAEIGGQEADTTSAGLDWLDFQAPGVSKATGLSLVASLLGVDQKQSAAIGDQHNDAAMLRWVNYSAAPENAIPEIRSQVHWIAPSNGGNGVSAFIEHLIDSFNS